MRAPLKGLYYKFLRDHLSAFAMPAVLLQFIFRQFSSADGAKRQYSLWSPGIVLLSHNRAYYSISEWAERGMGGKFRLKKQAVKQRLNADFKDRLRIEKRTRLNIKYIQLKSQLESGIKYV